MKKKMILSAAFIASLLPMLMSQYGGCKGVQEISGLTNLANPVGVASVILFVAAVWFPISNPSLRSWLGTVGTMGIAASEIYTFFTWHVATVTGKLSLQSSLRLAYPAFYVGLAASLAMAVVYLVMQNPTGD